MYERTDRLTCIIRQKLELKISYNKRDEQNIQEYYFSDYESWDWMIDVNIRGHLNAISKF